MWFVVMEVDFRVPVFYLSYFVEIDRLILFVFCRLDQFCPDVLLSFFYFILLCSRTTVGRRC